MKVELNEEEITEMVRNGLGHLYGIDMGSRTLEVRYTNGRGGRGLYAEANIGPQEMPSPIKMGCDELRNPSASLDDEAEAMLERAADSLRSDDQAETPEIVFLDDSDETEEDSSPFS